MTAAAPIRKACSSARRKCSDPASTSAALRSTSCEATTEVVAASSARGRNAALLPWTEPSGTDRGEPIADAAGAGPLADGEPLGEDHDPQLLEQPADLDHVGARPRAPEPSHEFVVAPLQRLHLGHPTDVAGDV